jgi:N-acetylmuramoyl-L-alanine amidase/Putative peptidoglycan binding domain
MPHAMPHSLIWLPHVLKSAGLKVALVEGWEVRGQRDVGPIQGVMCHHTATQRREGNMPTLKTLIEGRPDLRGPLAQLGLGRDGTFYVISAGRCNHAGAGVWRGFTNGNANFICIEAENTGLADDFPWPPVQMDAYHRGVAAILGHLGLGAECCAGHKEYARPLGRKPDPSFDMISFRHEVAAILNGTVPPPVLIPATEPAGPAAAPGRLTLRRGATHELVMLIQKKLGVEADGHFGPKTEAALRVFQRSRQLVADGIVGPKTWAQLDAVGPG